MIEVQAKLRFNNYCLGNRRHKRANRMLRDPEGRVIFMPMWWQSLMRYAAKVLSRHHKIVDLIDWDPVIDGQTKMYRRYYGNEERFQPHEAFFPGDIIGVNAVLPTELSISDFSQLLDIAGRYKGMSPYGGEKKYGTFEVMDVQKRKRVTLEEREAARNSDHEAAQTQKPVNQ
jgi:hypothetical protein